MEKTQYQFDGRTISPMLDGRSLKWLAESTGIAYWRIQRIRSNARLATANELVQLCRALGRNPEDFATA